MPENSIHRPEEKETWDDRLEERERALKRKRFFWIVSAAVFFVGALYGYDLYNLYVAKKAAQPSSAMQETLSASRQEEYRILNEKAFREADLKSAEGRHEEAKRILMQALARDPQNARIHYAVGMIYFHLGQLQSAFDFMMQATLLNPDYADARFQLANVYLYDKTFKAAADEAAKLARIPGARWQALLIESQIARADKKYDEAFGKYQAAEKAYGKPLGVRWSVYLAELYLDQGRKAEAGAVLRQTASQTAEAEDLLSMASTYVRLGDQGKAAEIFRNSLTRYPKNPDVLHAYGDYLFARGRVAEAIDYYRKTMALLPDASVLSYKIGHGYLVADKMEAFHGQIDAMLARDPKDLFALRLKVQYALAVGNRQDAIVAMNRIVAVLPFSPVPQLVLGSLYLQEGRYSLAAAAAQKALLLGDKSLSPHVLLANVYGRRGQFAEAKKSLEAILALDSRNLTALIQLADTCVSLGQYKEAEDHYARALALYPDMGEVRARTSWLRAVQGDPVQALALSKQYWREMPEDLQALGAYLNALVVNGRTDEAIAIALQQAGKRPQDWRPPFLLGDLHLANGNRAEALASYQKALALNPEDINLILNVAGRYQRAKLYAELETMLRSAHQRHPNNLLVANRLAWHYIDTAGDLPKAKPLVDQLYREPAKDASVLDTLGWYSFKAGDYKNAAYYLTEAATLFPDNAVIKGHLELAMQKVGGKK